MRPLALFRNFDWVLLLATLVLMTLGFSAIYSVDLSRGEELVYIPVQTIAACIGLVFCFVAGLTHLQVYRLHAKWAYLLALLLLVGVLFFGISIRGTRGWYRIAGFSFQPAEVAKAALVLVNAWIISRYGRRFETPHFFVITGITTTLLAGLILLQPDLGSALVLFGVWTLTLLAVRVRWRYLFLLFFTGAFAFIFAWFFHFEPYQKDRITTFLFPAEDPQGAGYNVTQSIIAIGSGGFFGRGLGFGSQSQLHFLPEAQTDFIFAVIAEELGFVGALLVFSLYFTLLIRLIRIAYRSRDEFGGYLALGIACIFFIQIFLNIGGTLGLVPITGVTLPFLSYGGSSLLMNLLLIGIAESVARAQESEVSYTSLYDPPELSYTA